MVDIIEWTTTLKDTLELTKLAHIATCVERDFDVSAQTESNLVGLMMQIAGDNMMPARAQLGGQAGAHRPQPACY
jgi:hypothetical protein